MRIRHGAKLYWREPTNPAQWTQGEHDDYDSWLREVVAQAGRKSQELHPVVQELQDRIENSTRLTQLVQGMYDELSLRPLPLGRNVPYSTDIDNYKCMLRSLNYLLTVPLLWSSYRYLVGWTSCPIFSIFWRPLHTTAGFAFFQDPEVNVMLKRILNRWGSYLKSPESAWCLDDGPECWFGPEALGHLIATANVTSDTQTHQTFSDIYVCDPSQPRHGFTSWDAFFTRHFRPGIRPLADPDDDSVIAHACESIPRRVQRNVQYSAKFWAKGTPYSLIDMLGHDNLSKQFISGTVYQAYLSALSYHRWHAPVSGTIIKATQIPGFYCSEPPYAPGFRNPEHNTASGEERLIWDTAYQTAVATRAVLFIEADNPRIGLVAALFVGMTEVSTCEIGVTAGQRVRRGEEIGLFHCGGSTHCLIFREAVELLGLPDPGAEEVQRIRPVRSCLARVKSESGCGDI